MDTFSSEKKNDDIVIKNVSKPFSSVFQSRDKNEKILCSLCANAGVESIVRDDICECCGDIGIKHGISDKDELFVVNSVGGGPEGSSSDSNNFFSGSFGGLPMEKRKPPTQSKTLQDALKETEISKP